MKNSTSPFSDEARIILDMEASADLLIRKNKNGISLCGIYLKRFNDYVYLKLFQDNIQQEDFKKFKFTDDQALWFTPEVKKSMPIISIKKNLKNQSTKQLCIPSLKGEERGTYFNFDCEWLNKKNDIILELENPSYMIQTSSNYENLESNLFDKGQSLDVKIFPDKSIQMLTRSSSYSFMIVLRCISVSRENATINISIQQNKLIITKNDKELQKCKFCLFIHPLPSNRLLGGIKTASFTASKFIFAIHDPFTPRIFNWLACAITSNTQIPIAIPANQNPNPVFPNLVMFHSNGQGWLLPSSEIARRHIENADVLVMLGDIDSSFFLGCVNIKKYKTVVLISENKEIIHNAFSPLSDNLEENKNNIPLIIIKDTTKAIGLFTSNILESNNLLEELFIQIVKETQNTEDYLTNEIWEYHIKNRMKALPYCGELSVGSISVLGNMLRGRLPNDDGKSEINYSKFYNDDLWMVPWSCEYDLSRTQLITELNIRIVTEYLAIRMFSELCENSYKYEEEIEVDDKIYYNELSNISLEWENWGSLTKNQKNETRKKMTRLIQEYQKIPEEIIKGFSKVLYDSSSELSFEKKRNRRNEKKTLINPLVLVYASGSDTDSFDLMLDFNSSFWALYAGQLSSAKSGAIIPTLLPEKIVIIAKKMQAALRLEILTYNNESEKKDSVFEKRKALGNFIKETIESSIYHLLDTLNADRIVTFSDILIDFLPFNDSILGLEYPISRYPANLPAYISVNSALSNSYFVMSPKRVNNVGVLYPDLGTDPVTKWANELAEDFKSHLKLLGLDSISIDNYQEPEEFLKHIQNNPIIIFLGHGHASQYWAGLSLGTKWLSIREFSEYNWNDSFIFLIGCETAALDTTDGDLARMFLTNGARGVIGTTAKVRIDVASVFCTHMISELIKGLPADYSFFFARKKAFIFEALISSGESRAKVLVDEIFNSEKGLLPTKKILDMFSIKFEDAMASSLYSLTFTLLGGANQTLV